jgi:flagellar motility protein MotE (MotC chaperone)
VGARYLRSAEYTGSVCGEAGSAAPEKAAAPEVSASPPAEPKPSLSPGERAVLESLAQRRQELEARAREIDVRDSLLKAAEKRIEQRLQELKELEARVNGAVSKKDEEEAGKFKSLVGMYENMKAKDAAKVFDRLNMRVLVELVNAMNPRRMADILAQMTPEWPSADHRNRQPLRRGRQGADHAPPICPRSRAGRASLTAAGGRRLSDR